MKAKKDIINKFLLPTISTVFFFILIIISFTDSQVANKHSVATDNRSSTVSWSATSGHATELPVPKAQN